MSSVVGLVSRPSYSIPTNGLPYPYLDEFHPDREENFPLAFPIFKYLGIIPYI